MTLASAVDKFDKTFWAIFDTIAEIATEAVAAIYQLRGEHKEASYRGK